MIILIPLIVIAIGLIGLIAILKISDFVTRKSYINRKHT